MRRQVLLGVTNEFFHHFDKVMKLTTLLVLFGCNFRLINSCRCFLGSWHSGRRQALLLGSREFLMERIQFV